MTRVTSTKVHILTQLPAKVDGDGAANFLAALLAKVHILTQLHAAQDFENRRKELQAAYSKTAELRQASDPQPSSERPAT